MTDRKPDALAPSSRPGALTKAPTGDLVSRGLADLNVLEQATPDAEECYEPGRRSFNEQLLVCREDRDYSEAPLASAGTPQNRGTGLSSFP